MTFTLYSQNNVKNWNNPLYIGASVTLGQAVLLLMVFAATTGLTQEALGNLLHILVLLLPEDSLFPTTKYLFKKFFAKGKFDINHYSPNWS